MPNGNAKPVQACCCCINCHLGGFPKLVGGPGETRLQQHAHAVLAVSSIPSGHPFSLAQLELTLPGCEHSLAAS